MLVFGCRNVIFKLDGEGLGTLICRDDFAKCREYNLAGWSDAEFRHMAILSGCDYLDSVAGLGLKTAHKLLRKYKTPEKVRETAVFFLASKVVVTEQAHLLCRSFNSFASRGT